MPFGFDATPAKKRRKHGRVTVNKTERFLAPDSVDKVTVKAFGQNITVWKAAAKCPKCRQKLTNVERCPDATGKRKWCQR